MTTRPLKSEQVKGDNPVHDPKCPKRFVTAPVSHQNNLNKPAQARSRSNENQVKSTKLIDSPPLITVWLHVRVR
ncbi:hypothetical protein [Bradyrhizobium sp. S3.2.12]|uniref:hypothetical protein n=1 Tax=Bradyrhizobium sp. S3.2.12 TaxID=3156387 RepID=UPI00339744D8